VFAASRHGNKITSENQRMALPLVEIPEQTTSDEIDEEILEIFLEEAEEVLEEIRANYADWKNNPSDKEALQNVRRAFHTLKGSGRLVGAMVIGELGWNFESMLNRVIDGTMSGNSSMFKLIDQVEDMIPPLIEQFKTGAPPFYEAVLLMSQAKQLTDSKGADMGEFVSQAESGLPALGEDGDAPAAGADSVDLDALDDAVDLDALETSTDEAADAVDLDADLALTDSADDGEIDLDAMPDAAEDALDLDLPDIADDLGSVDDGLSDLSDDLDGIGDLDGLDDVSDVDDLGDMSDDFAGVGDLDGLDDVSDVDDLGDMSDDFAGVGDLDGLDDVSDVDDLGGMSDDFADAGDLDGLDDVSGVDDLGDMSDDFAGVGNLDGLDDVSDADDFAMPEILSELEDYDADAAGVDILDDAESADEITPELLANSAIQEQAMLDKLAPEEAPDEEDIAAQQALQEIFQGEAQDHLQELKQLIVACKNKLPCPCSEKLFRVFHTLNGSSRSVGLDRIAKLAGAAERFVRTALDVKLNIHKEQLALMIESGKLFQVILKQQGELGAQQPVYDKVLGEWDALNHELEEKYSAQEKPAEIDEDAYEDADEKDAAVDAAPPPETLPAADPAPAVHEEDGVDDEFLEIFLEEADEILETSQSLVGRWLAAPNSMPLLKELQRELHTLKGGSRMVGIASMGDLSHQLESVLTRIVEGNAQSNSRFQELVQQSLDELASMLELVREGETPPAAKKLIEEIKVVVDVGHGQASEEKASQQQTDAPAKAPTQTQEETEATASDSSDNTDTAPAADKAAPDKAPAASSDDSGDTDERVRVRATLIDKLTNLAGEMSIQRAHMEQQQGVARGSLNEMEQTIVRLRDQLRRLDIETEVQIVSHFGDMQGPDGEDFDPLEMDRFSTMQQLSRSLMETVNDLQSIQESLKNTIRQSEYLLIQQNRIGSDMQDSIMGTRLVPFSQISPRLQRIARLTSRELKKQVEFKINDDDMEFERTILNRIVAPLEHMLRNAIGHGVEQPEQRRAVNKSPTATVIIDISQEGAEIIIRMRDDGAGINTDAIRKKAERKGLLKPGQGISDQDLYSFILEPAFSTAEKVTQVSGRGVGMDIVNSEIKQLSGTLNIYSSRGQGTTFEIRIPTSLTITKCLLVHLGEETLAIPVDNVDAVMRVPREQVLPNESAGQEIHHFNYMGLNYRAMHLAELLNFTHPSSVDTALLPMLLVSSGENRLALLIDGIEGSKEVAVKPVGPQLGSIRWLAGATILGDGRVVLILDILTLMRTQMSRDAKLVRDERHEETLAALESAKPKVRTVMVVDDSITVRKVTARFLKRQGLEVITAKDGLDAVGQLQEMKPDIMLLDVEMPRMDGFELATQIRNDDRLQDLPIIMITSRTGEKHRERASKIGIDRHLGKPFNENELLTNIDELLTERGK
jgi:chemosensory pili system protein ChpA (sensor histidine kinase/response regulator)